MRGTVTSIRYEDGQNAADRSGGGARQSRPAVGYAKHIKGYGFQPFPTGIKVGPVKAGDLAPEGTFDIANGLRLSPRLRAGPAGGGLPG